MAGQTRPIWDFEDVGDWWTRADPRRHRADRRGADHGRHRLGSRPRRRHHRRGDAHQEGHLPPDDAAGDRHRRPGAHRRHAAPSSPPAPAWMRWRIASRPIARRATTRWPTASRSKACGWCSRTCPRPSPTATTSRRARHMMSAAAMGATAFQKGLGAIHALSHPVGALYDTHHGMTNAVFMPYVLAFNRAGHRGAHRAAGRLSAASRAASTASSKAILKLRKELNVPHTLPRPIKGLDMDDERARADRRHGDRRSDRRRQPGRADQEGGAGLLEDGDRRHGLTRSPRALRPGRAESATGTFVSRKKNRPRRLLAAGKRS